jgi:hypothetical protein
MAGVSRGDGLPLAVGPALAPMFPARLLTGHRWQEGNIIRAPGYA